jgi:hypothetical protein
MKLKKIVAVLVAVVMVATLAVSAAARPVITADIREGSGNTPWGSGLWGIQTHIAGRNAASDMAIDPWIISGVRFRFSNITFFEADEANERTGVAVGDMVVNAATVINTTPTDFAQLDFVMRQDDPSTWVVTRNFTHDPEDTGFLQVSVALWNPGTSARVAVEILGPEGQVLAAGTTEEMLAAQQNNNSSSNNNNSTSRPGGTTTSPGGKTGLGGIAILGGVAILAAGAVVVSRKRK